MNTSVSRVTQRLSPARRGSSVMATSACRMNTPPRPILPPSPRADKHCREVSLKAYVLAVIVAGVGVAGYCVYDLLRHPVGPEWIVLVVLTVASSWASLRIPGWPINFSISDIFNIVAALLFGPAAGAITAAVDGLVLSARMDKNQRSIDRVLFNMAAVTIAVWVAAQVFFAI